MKINVTRTGGAVHVVFDNCEAVTDISEGIWPVSSFVGIKAMGDYAIIEMFDDSQWPVCHTGAQVQAIPVEKINDVSIDSYEKLMENLLVIMS